MNTRILALLILITTLISGLCYLQATPVTTATGYDTDWNNIDQNVTLTCVDVDGNCVSTDYQVDDSNIVTIDYDANSEVVMTITLDLADGNHQIDFNSTDNDGNIETTNTIYIAIDKTPPVTTIDGNSAITNIDQNITLTCDDNFSSDGNFSDCNSIKYSIDDANFVDYNAPLIFTTADNTTTDYTLEYYSIDNIANEETPQTVTLTIDKKDPTIDTSSVTNITDESAKLNAHLTESGYCRYSEDDTDVFGDMSSSTQTSGLTIYWTLTGLNDDTDYEYYIACVDLAGNPSDIETLSFTTDASSGTSSTSSSSDDEEVVPLVISVSTPNTLLSTSAISTIEATLRLNNVDLTNKTVLANTNEILVIRKTTSTVTDGRGTFYFTINVKNKTNTDKNISIIETIPKEIASLASKITFITLQTKIIKADPIIQWDVIVPANKDVNIAYKVTGITNTTVVKDNSFIKSWVGPVALVQNPVVVAVVDQNITCADDNNCTTDILDANGVCVHTNICVDTNAALENTKDSKPKGEVNNLLWLYILGGFNAIAMIFIGILEIRRNSNPMAHGFKPSIFGNKRKRR